LLDYELNVARYDRKGFLQSYSTITKTVSVILVLIIFGVLFVTYYVFRSIQKENTKLEIATQKLKIANKKLQEASYTDSLTGLYNRRYFNYIYKRELQRARREKKYVSFMMMDIDYFKQYNDTYGHIAGDLALKRVAKVIKNSFRRPSDFVFRLGGEEFGVLIIGVDEQNCETLAQKVVENVKKEAIEHKNSQVCDVVTLSVGVACCVADDSLDDEMLLQTADAMLYKAKEEGRNRYEVAKDFVTDDKFSYKVA
jgi:diguanylate cyclase (GGDEF)-like protein